MFTHLCVGYLLESFWKCIHFVDYVFTYLQPLRLIESKGIAFIGIQLNIGFFFSIHQIMFFIMSDFILMIFLKAKYL